MIAGKSYFRNLIFLLLVRKLSSSIIYPLIERPIRELVVVVVVVTMN